MQCAKCSKPATLACGACKMSPDLDGDTAITHYCSAVCQKADWGSHKPICQRLKDRTMLYRVAKLAQELFYIYKEVRWGKIDIQAVENTDDELILHGRICHAFTWPQDYKVFPSHLFPEDQDRNATLSYNGCVHALCWMVEFVEGMPKDVVVEVKHMEVRTKNDRRRTKLAQPGVLDLGGGVRHQVLKLTLRSGEIFAVDLSGAQFGYPEPVTLWDSYEDRRVSEVLHSTTAPEPRKVLNLGGYSLQRHFSLDQQIRQPSQGRMIFLDMLEMMNIHFMEWQEGEKVTFKSLWALREDEYHRKRQNLLDYVEWKFNSVLGRQWYTVRGRRLRDKYKALGTASGFLADRSDRFVVGC